MVISDSIKIILDLSLGDGGIYPSGRSHYFSFTHSLAQLDYALHKATLLQSYGYSVRGKQHTWPSGKQGYNVATRSHPNIDFVHSMLYSDKKKIITPALLSMLDSRSLAYFFMDDGFARLRNKTKGKYETRIFSEKAVNNYGLSTYNFTLEENLLIIDWLNANFDIHAVIGKQKFGNTILIHRIQDKDKLRDIIKPYIISSMEYKINRPHQLKGIPFITKQL